jgi:hypothetical protein
VVRINQTVDDVKRAKHYIGLLDVYGFEFFEVNSFAACKCSSRRPPSSPQIRLRVLRSELVRAAVHQLCEREASAILPLDRLWERRQGVQGGGASGSDRLWSRLIPSDRLWSPLIASDRLWSLIVGTQGIAWTPIAYQDNKQIIDLCENATGGIFKLLDSACKAPNATGKAFCSGLHEAHGKKSAAVFGAPKMGKAEKRGKEDHFLVKHFAGEVIYFAGDEKEPGTLSWLPSSVTKRICLLRLPLMTSDDLWWPLMTSDDLWW